MLGQNLTGLAFLNRILEQKLAEKGIPEAKDAARVSEVIKQAIAQARALSRGLCPIDQKAEGLVTALQALAGNITEFYGISCLFESQPPVLVRDMGAAMHLYHIAQEAINNGIKHGKADQVRISLSDEGDGFVLRVRGQRLRHPRTPRIRQGHRPEHHELPRRDDRRRAGGQAHPEGGTVVTCTCRHMFRPALTDDADPKETTA